MNPLTDHRTIWPPETLGFLIAAGLAILLTLALPDGGGTFQVVVLAIAVVVLGLPHGALDPWIARQHGLMRSEAAFQGQYLGLALLVIATWWALPGISLLLFLAFSAWHFGQDWRRVSRPGFARRWDFHCWPCLLPPIRRRSNSCSS